MKLEHVDFERLNVIEEFCDGTPNSTSSKSQQVTSQVTDKW